MMKYILLYILLFFLNPAHFCAQDMKRYSRSQIDSLINPPLLKVGESILRFASVKKDIGTLSEDDAPCMTRFSFRNVSKSAVTITRITTSCGCTAAQFDKKAILSGEESSISLTYHPKNHPGTIDVNAFIYTNVSEISPVVRLSLIGDVVPGMDEWSRFPYVIGELRLKRVQLNFPELTSSTSSSERILCGNSGKLPLKLSAPILPSYMTFRTEPEVIQPGQEADIVITVDGSKVSARVNEPVKYTLLLEGVNVRPADRTLKITLKLIN